PARHRAEHAAARHRESRDRSGSRQWRAGRTWRQSGAFRPAVKARALGRGESGWGEIARLDALDARRFHRLPGFRQRTLGINAAAGILDHEGLEFLLAGVHCRPGDAESRRQTSHEDALDAALLQIAAESGRGLAVGLGKRGVAVDILVEPLADDE